jgi:hypothetical protein
MKARCARCGKPHAGPGFLCASCKEADRRDIARKAERQARLKREAEPSIDGSTIR